MLRKLQERHLEHITYQQASAKPPGQVGDVTPAQGGGGAWGLPEWGADPRASRRERPWPGRSTPCPTWSARPGTGRTSGTFSWRPAVPPSVPPGETSAGGDPGGAVCSAEPPPHPWHSPPGPAAVPLVPGSGQHLGSQPPPDLRRHRRHRCHAPVSPPPTQPFGVPAGKHPPGTKILSHWGTQRPSVLCTELPRQMGSGSRELIIFIFYFFWGGVPSRWQASKGGGTRGDFGAVLPLKLNTRQRGAVPASRSSPGTASGRRGPAMDALRPGGLWERAPSCFLAGARVCTYRGVRASVLRVYACAAYVWGGAACI